MRAATVAITVLLLAGMVAGSTVVSDATIRDAGTSSDTGEQDPVNGTHTNGTGIDAVILVSTANFPDTFVAAGPATRYGIPVLLTGWNTVPEPTSNQLDALNPSRIILIGGPAVISEQVETTLEQSYDVVRLWGKTQIGTSAAVAEYFWPGGTDDVVIVQYPQYGHGYWRDGFELLSRARGDIRNKPVLVADPGDLPYETVDTVAALGATEVRMFTPEPLARIEDPLQAVGVDNTTLIWPDTDASRKHRYATVNTTYNGTDRLQLIAATTYTEVLHHAAVPGIPPHIVTGDGELDDVRTLLKTVNPGTVTVTGSPDLAAALAAITAELGVPVDRRTGTPPAVAAALFTETRKTWEQAHRGTIETWDVAEDTLQKQADRFIDRAMDVIVRERHRDAYEQLKTARRHREQGAYGAAIPTAVQAYSSTRMASFESRGSGTAPSDQYEEVEQERRSIQDVADRRDTTIASVLIDIRKQYISAPEPEDAAQLPVPEPGDELFEAAADDGSWISYANPRDAYRVHGGPDGSGKLCVTLLNANGSAITGTSVPDTTVTVPASSNLDWHPHTPFTVKFPLTDHYDVPMDADQFGTSPDISQGDGYLDSHCIEFHGMPENATITYNEPEITGLYSDYIDVVGYVQQAHHAWETDIDPVADAQPYEQVGGWTYTPGGSHGQAVVILQVNRTQQ